MTLSLAQLQELTRELRALGATTAKVEKVRNTSMYRATATWKDLEGHVQTSTVDLPDPVAALREVRDSLIEALGVTDRLPLLTNDPIPPTDREGPTTIIREGNGINTGPGRGPKGETGEKGDRGDRGEDGTDGTDGTDGLSAFDIAVINGWTGDEPDWLLHLIGPRGPKGDDGDPGPAGQTFVHTQDMPSQNWDIVHNLHVVPSVRVVDTGETVWIPEVRVVSLDEVILHFDVPGFAGTAYLS